MQRISPETRRLAGGAACLDFANSVDWDSDGTERPPHTDVLAAPEDLAIWGRRLGLAPIDGPLFITGHELKAARALRRTIHDVFAEITDGATPDSGALAHLAGNYQQATGASRLTQADGCWRLDWPEDDPRRIRFAVAVNAFDLLCDQVRLSRLRMCPGGNCGWLFLDTSGRRRWCTMEVCGSRAKMRRLYQRQHHEPAESSGKSATSGRESKLAQ